MGSKISKPNAKNNIKELTIKSVSIGEEKREIIVYPNIECAIDAITTNVSLFANLEEKYMLNEQILSIILMYNRTLLQYLPKSAKLDQALAIWLLMRDFHTISFMDRSLLSDKEFMLEAIKLDGKVYIKIAGTPLSEDDDVVECALKSYGTNLRWMANLAAKWTPAKRSEYYIMALKSDFLAYRWINMEATSDQLFLDLISVDSEVIMYFWNGFFYSRQVSMTKSSTVEVYTKNFNQFVQKTFDTWMNAHKGCVMNDLIFNMFSNSNVFDEYQNCVTLVKNDPNVVLRDLPSKFWDDEQLFLLKKARILFSNLDPRISRSCNVAFAFE